MIHKKILNYLIEFFKKTDPNKKYNDKMKKILSKLNDRALKLEVQLENENNEEKRKNIYIMLKVIYKQQAKGEKLMQERERSSHSSRKDKIVIKPALCPPIRLEIT
ncbi:MAG: hypothetical protein KAI22_07750 [Gammaproteobacteria bacterium]|nr:hypothetical protein [Gammaproteobacteria bacterium]